MPINYEDQLLNSKRGSFQDLQYCITTPSQAVRSNVERSQDKVLKGTFERRSWLYEWNLGARLNLGRTPVFGEFKAAKFAQSGSVASPIRTSFIFSPHLTGIVMASWFNCIRRGSGISESRYQNSLILFVMAYRHKRSSSFPWRAHLISKLVLSFQHDLGTAPFRHSGGGCSEGGPYFKMSRSVSGLENKCANSASVRLL